MFTQQFFEAEFQIGEQTSDVHATELWFKGLQVGHAAAVHFAGSTEIAAFEMEQTDGRVDQSVKERLFGSDEFRPEVFEHVVTFKELTFVEQANSIIDAGICWIKRHVGPLRKWILLT